MNSRLATTGTALTLGLASLVGCETTVPTNTMTMTGSRGHYDVPAAEVDVFNARRKASSLDDTHYFTLDRSVEQPGTQLVYNGEVLTQELGRVAVPYDNSNTTRTDTKTPVTLRSNPLSEGGERYHLVNVAFDSGLVVNTSEDATRVTLITSRETIPTEIISGATDLNSTIRYGARRDPTKDITIGEGKGATTYSAFRVANPFAAGSAEAPRIAFIQSGSLVPYENEVRRKGKETEAVRGVTGIVYFPVPEGLGQGFIQVQDIPKPVIDTTTQTNTDLDVIDVIAAPPK